MESGFRWMGDPPSPGFVRLRLASVRQGAARMPSVWREDCIALGELRIALDRFPIAAEQLRIAPGRCRIALGELRIALDRLRIGL